MKKIKYLLFIFLMIILIKIPNVFAKGKVEIESVDLIDKSEDATEVNTPTIYNLSIGLDLKFATLNDYIKYKIVINNSTDEDYELSDKNLNASEYITYEYSFEDDVKVVKKNSKLVVYITAKYSKELPKEKFENSEYKDNNSIVISLANDYNSIKNPNTSDKFNIYLTVLLLSSIAIIGLILTKKTHDKKYLSLLSISLMLIPTSIYALKKVEITIHTKATIEEKYSLSYLIKKSINLDLYVIKDDMENKNYENCSEEYSYIIQNDDGTINQYIKCENAMVKDTEKYSPGKRVNIKDLSNIYFTSSEINDSLCTIDNETNLPKCPRSAIEKKSNLNYFYDIQFNPTFSHNEIILMNFENLDHEYDEYVVFYNPNSFTMLNHDIIFEMVPSGLDPGITIEPYPGGIDQRV